MSKNQSKFWTVIAGGNPLINGFCPVTPWQGRCLSCGVSINGIKVAGWAEAEHRKKIRADWDHRFFGQVRGAFILLLFAAIYVFVFNHQLEVQLIASAKLHEAAKKITTPDKLRQQALKHENEVEQINPEFHNPS